MLERLWILQKHAKMVLENDSLVLEKSLNFVTVVVWEPWVQNNAFYCFFMCTGICSKIWLGKKKRIVH
jgi:hypothetical protein